MADVRTFVLSGAASGIGLHVTDRLLREGHRVLAADIRLDHLQEEAVRLGWPSDRVELCALDVRDPASWETALDRAAAAFGPVDVLMNIAGVLRPGYVHAIDSEQVHSHVDVNLKGVMFGTMAAARRMVPQRRGHIVNIASMAGLVPVPGLALYSASKYGVRAFSIAAGLELRPYQVAVTVVCLDPVETPMLALQRQYPEAALTFTAARILTVDEVVSCLLGNVLQRRPLQVILPRHRGWVARLADMIPAAGLMLYPLFRRQGLHKQAARH